MSVLVLGSRTFAPLEAVDRELEDQSSIYSFGVSDVAIRAEELGARRKPLETTRTTLLNMAAEPDAAVWLFVARDAETKQPTAGMSQVQHVLTEKQIEFRVISSPLPGIVCELITNLRHAVDKTMRALPGARQDNAMGKALGHAMLVLEKKDEYERKMEQGFHYEVGNLELDDRFIRWVRIYEALCDALKDAERMLVVA